MGKASWNFVLANPRNVDSLRAVRAPKIVLILIAVVAFVGVAGFVRVAHMGASYAWAVLDARGDVSENESLKEKIESLDKFMQQETESIARLVAYEDHARLKYGMEAISGDVRKAGIGGIPSDEDLLYASMRDPLIMKAEALRLRAMELYHQAGLQESTFVQISDSVNKMHRRLAERPAIWPANGRLTSPFGYRMHPVSGLYLRHEGLDIANTMWTPIYAPANGRVLDVKNWTFFGNTVRLSHNNGEYVTLFAHMQKPAVIQGQFVKRGDIIGYMGTTGRSTGSHLHYEVHHNGRVVDPMAFIVAVDQIVD